MITRSSKLHRSTSTESSDSGKSNTPDASSKTNVDQPGGKFSLGIPAHGTADDLHYLDPVEAPITRRYSGITLVNVPGEGQSTTESFEESITEIDDESNTDIDSDTRVDDLKVIDVDVPVGGANSNHALSKCTASRKCLIYVAGGFATFLMFSVTTALLVRAYGPKPQPTQTHNPDFDWSVFDAFSRCAVQLGLDLTPDDRKVITELVKNLGASYSRQLASINDIGALLECRPDNIAKYLGGIYPDKVTDNLAGIFSDFGLQMEALANAAAAAAGFSSPSACLIVLSLIYLFASGIV